MANNSKKTAMTSEASAESPAGQSSTNGKISKVSKTAVIILGIVIFGIIALFTTISVVVHLSRLRASEVEFESLRAIAADIEIDHEEFGVIELGQLDEEMRRINSDYVCWIRIDGTNIDYPVVRGPDNDKYLDTSFHGQKSITGTVFMDYRIYGDLLADNAEDLIPHIIIYGHNLQQGGIFTDLRKLLNDQFLEDNNRIKLIVNDEVIEFEIFAARRSDIEDPAYFLEFNASYSFPRFADRIDAPLKATQILTLSTCLGVGNQNARLIVQGYRLI